MILGHCTPGAMAYLRYLSALLPGVCLSPLPNSAADVALTAAATAIAAAVATATATGAAHKTVAPTATAAAEQQNEDDDPTAATETIVIAHIEDLLK